MSASIAELLRAGVTVEPDEAVAIAQQVIAALGDDGPPVHVDPPFGPPTIETVVLHADGSVACCGCDATPAVSEIARLLQAMLPDGSSRLPGALRYTIARALLEVDAPPFDSIDVFSHALSRFERGNRAHASARVLRRMHAARALAPVPVADRRQHPQATALRRALREADARLYVQAMAPPTIIVTPRPAAPRSHGAPLACVAAGLLLVGAGELMHAWHALAAAPPLPPPVAAPVPFAPRPAAIAPAASPEPALVSDAAPRAAAVRRPPTRARRAAVSHVRASRARTRSAQPRGVPGFLRFRWLKKFARADL